MNDSAKLQIEVLEKIGAPLMAAIFAAKDRTLDDAKQGERDAEMLAALLSRAVQAGVSLSALLETTDQGDQTRLALTALAAPILASYFKRQGGVPEESDVKRLTGALQTVIPFAANFKGAGDAALNAAHQPLILLQTFAPVAEAIHAFPFGQSEAKLLGDVASKLIAKAESIAQDVTGSKDGAAQNHIVRALAEIYTAAHKAQTSAQSSSSLSPEAGLAKVWESFDMRAGMISALAHMLVGGKKPESSGSSSSSKSPAPPSNTEGNPMSLFAKKPSSDAPPTATPQSPPQSPPPADKPPGNAGSPMSFFKPGAKKEGGGQTP